MSFFEKYSSNTYAGSANQLYFSTNGEVCVGRVYYKISVGGEYEYSILFSNTIDSTYSDGKVSQKNLVCGEWKIHSAKIGRCSKMSNDDIARGNAEACDFVDLTFNGSTTKTVAPAELFASDGIRYFFEKGEYLCLEIAFSGDMIPYHEESLLPVFIKGESGWKYCKQMPFASMIGCDRKIEKRVAYLGDSITQGIGVPTNCYGFWNALVSEACGDKNAYWNLGIGFGRANDASSDGAWLYKAKQNDVVVVCFGVNDICQGFSEEQIRRDLDTIVERLNDAGCKVVLQTIPPFDYDEEKAKRWLRINEYIKTTLANKVELAFDVVPYLGKSESEPHIAQYGGHPNEQGSAVWASALYEKIANSGII